MVIGLQFSPTYHHCRSSLQSRELIWRPGTGLLTISGLHDVFQIVDVSLKHENAVSLRFQWTCHAGPLKSMLQDRHALNCQRKSEGSPPRFREPPECSLTKATDDLRCLAQIEIAVTTLIDIRLGFSHPETQPRSTRNGNAEINFLPKFVPHPNSQADGFFD